MELLSTQVEHRNGWVVVTVRGQLDVATAPDLRQLLVEAAFSDGHGLVVDLDGLEFIDSMGLGVLLGALKRARTHGTSFALVYTRERILRLLELTQLTDILPIVDRVEALPAAAPPPTPSVGSEEESAGGTP